MIDRAVIWHTTHRGACLLRGINTCALQARHWIDRLSGCVAEAVPQAQDPRVEAAEAAQVGLQPHPKMARFNEIMAKMNSGTATDADQMEIGDLMDQLDTDGAFDPTKYLQTSEEELKAAEAADARRAAIGLPPSASDQEVEAAEKQAAAEYEAIRWCVAGALAKHGNKVGEVTQAPNYDKEFLIWRHEEVVIYWSDGKSDYIKALDLTQPSITDQRHASSWCTRGTHARFHGKMGTLVMSPDSNADVKLKYPDGRVSGYIKAVRVHPLSASEEQYFRATGGTVEVAESDLCDEDDVANRIYEPDEDEPVAEPDEEALTAEQEALKAAYSYGWG